MAERRRLRAPPAGAYRGAGDRTPVRDSGGAERGIQASHKAYSRE